MNISEELKQVLMESGAALVGFGDLKDVEGAPYRYGVSVAIPVPVHIVKEIEDGPTEAYKETYHDLNRRLDAVIRAGEKFLKEQGWQVAAQTTDSEYVKQNEDWRTPLPHKTVATRCGLGWIGKCCLLVTPEYGGAVRISSLITDAPLNCNEPIDESRCGECTECVDHCPAHAITGVLWDKDTDRSIMLDKQLCNDTMGNLMLERTGEFYEICGKCFVVCPYTRRYINENNRES